jgi:hypothetical protein
MVSRFERVLLEQQQAIAKSSVTEVPLGDSHQHAALKGRYDGIQFALDEFRKQRKENLDPDDEDKF